MLHIVGTHKELEKIHTLPSQVISEATTIVKMLDETYGEDRDILNDDGGYVCIIENNNDLEELKSRYDVDLYKAIPEYCTKLSNGWLNIFILCNNEYGINVILSTQTTVSKSFNEYM